jgi:hypothetical protein
MLVFAAVGAIPAILCLSLDRRTTIKRLHRSLNATRAAIVDESAILSTLDPESDAAAALQGVIQTRVNSYLGLDPKRPKLFGPIFFTAVFAAFGVVGAIAVARATKDTDVAVYSAFCGFWATMSLLVAVSIARTLRQWRRRARPQIGPPPDSEMTEFRADSAEPSKTDA